MKSCNTCTLCCKLLEIKQLNKPAGVWCLYCVPTEGCRIHDIGLAECGGYKEVASDECKQFACRWLTDETMSEDLRPDKIKAILLTMRDTETQAERIGMVVERIPLTTTQARLVDFMRQRIDVVVIVGEKHIFIPKVVKSNV